MRAKIVACAAAVASLTLVSGCGFSPYKLPLPGGADLGSKPYTVQVQFRDVLDLVPQSAVRVNDIAVGKVKDIKLEGWTAVVTIEVNRDAKLPDNTEATIRQTSLLGEKFVSLAPPATGASGSLDDGDKIPLDRSGRNPEIEEVLGAASLLFNGGGLEKTNTIVKELNNALGGNEPEVKELIASTSSFIGQLDDNKAALLTSLEKINRLSVAANDQEDAIVGALEDLPEALRVVNDQRDDLVGLLESLDRLSNVATGVIQRSKADTVANLKALTPTLRNLARAGDDLATATRALVTYPFSDGFVGNTLAAATGTCQDAGDGRPEIKEGACFGDFANLSLSLDISATQLSNLLGGFDLSNPTGAQAGGTESAGGGASATDSIEDLLGSLQGLGQPSPSAQDAAPGGPATGTTPTPANGDGLLCSLVGQCRTAAAGSASADLSRLLFAPVEAP
ncbi:MAG: hypothetical protein JWP31_2004 [Aeromicrobium sp.]|nr:hypothetical protein [Aeromicrobium sp.]